MSVTNDKAAKMNVYDLLTKVVMTNPTKERGKCTLNLRARLVSMSVANERALSQSYVEYGRMRPTLRNDQLSAADLGFLQCLRTSIQH